LAEEIPDLLIGRMKDVRPIAMNMNAINGLSKAVSSDVVAALKDENPLTAIGGNPRETCPIETRTDNQEVIAGLCQTV